MTSAMEDEQRCAGLWMLARIVVVRSDRIEMSTPAGIHRFSSGSSLRAVDRLDHVGVGCLATNSSTAGLR